MEVAVDEWGLDISRIEFVSLLPDDPSSGEVAGDTCHVWKSSHLLLSVSMSCSRIQSTWRKKTSECTEIGLWKSRNIRDRKSANFLENFARRLIGKWKVRSLLFLQIVLLGDCCCCCWEERAIVADAAKKDCG